MDSDRTLLSLIITVCLVRGYCGQSLEYAVNDYSFESKLNVIDAIDDQLVVLYFADNNNCDQYDEPVKHVVLSFLDVLVIRINTVICREAQIRVAVDRKRFIKRYPTFVFRQKGENLDKFDTFKNVGEELSARINHAKGFYGNTFKVASSDNDLSAKRKAVDENDQMAVIFFVFKNTDHDEFANRVAKSFPNIVVIKVDTSFCPRDEIRFARTMYPAFFVRNSSQNKEMYEGNQIDFDDMINKINGLYGNKFQVAI